MLLHLRLLTPGAPIGVLMWTVAAGQPSAAPCLHFLNHVWKWALLPEILCKEGHATCNANHRPRPGPIMPAHLFPSPRRWQP